MANLLKDRLKSALSETGKSARSVSIEATGKPDTIRDIFRRGITPGADTLVNLARALGKPDLWLLPDIAADANVTKDRIIPVRVIGFAQAGPFMEVEESVFDDNSRWTATVADPEFPGIEPFALEIRGDSINLKCDEGGYAICLPFADTGLQIKDQSWYVVDRIRGGLRERTIKQARKARGGRWELHPASTNPKHKPLSLPAARDADEVQVFAVVRRFISPALPA